MRFSQQAMLFSVFVLVLLLSGTFATSHAISVSTQVESYAQGGSSQVQATTDVQNSNESNTTIYKRIESNVNGEKKVVESRESGETSLVVPTMYIQKTTLHESLAQSIKEFIANLFKKIFSVR